MIGTIPHVSISKTQRVPLRYVPKNLTKKDRAKQIYELRKSRKSYKKGIYHSRPKISSFPQKKSKHIANAMRIFGVNSVKPNRNLARKTQCSLKTLKKIVKKGEGAYFSSGSRPSQTAQSWGYARLASSLTGGKASLVDYSLLVEGCSPKGKVLSMANKTRKMLKK
jgi:hypothetical protein